MDIRKTGGGEAQMGNINATISFRTESSDNHVVPNYWPEKGKKLIDEDYARLSGVEDICRELGISSSYLREAFSAALGTSPKVYLTQVRIEKARLLLADKSAPIHEVARIVGYRQTVSFEKAFKKLVGVPPSKFRGGGRYRRFLQAKMTGDFDTFRLT
jgi:AraC-like DNA-binding protein